MSTTEEPEYDEESATLIEMWRQHMLNKQKSMLKPAEFEICGYNFIGYPDVFWLENDEPCQDLALNFPKVEKAKSHFLEIGCGSGWLSVVHYLRNKDHIDKVVAVDINKSALNNTIENFKRYQIPGTVKYSDVFDSISEDEKFDTIFWNTPFLYASSATKNLSDIEKSILDPGYRCIERYIAGVEKYLNKDGRAFMSFSIQLGQMCVLERIAEKHHKHLEFVWSKTYESLLQVSMEFVEITPA